MIINKSKVVLPDWLLDQQATLSEQHFSRSVRDYLFRKYPEYELVRVEAGLAVCHFYTEEKKPKTKRRRKKA